MIRMVGVDWYQWNCTRCGLVDCCLWWCVAGDRLSSVDVNLLFHSLTSVLSQVIERQQHNNAGAGSCSDCVLTARGPYQPLWQCVITVYCSSLTGKVPTH